MDESNVKRWGSAIAAVVAIWCAAAPAAADPLLARGTQELALHLSPDFEGAIGDTIFAEAGYGWFVRDRLLLRGTAGYTLLEDVGGPEGDYKMHEFDLVAELHFPLRGALVPYVGAGVGWSRFELNLLQESALTYGPRVGLKIYVADNAAVDFALAYRLSSADVFVNDFQAEDTDLSGTIGFRFSF